MSAQEIQDSIAKIERRIHVAEIQNAKPITLEILCGELAELKQQLSKAA